MRGRGLLCVERGLEFFFADLQYISISWTKWCWKARGSEILLGLADGREASILYYWRVKKCNITLSPVSLREVALYRRPSSTGAAPMNTSESYTPRAMLQSPGGCKPSTIFSGETILGRKWGPEAHLTLAAGVGTLECQQANKNIRFTGLPALLGPRDR